MVAIPESCPLQDIRMAVLHGTVDPDNSLGMLRANSLVWSHVFNVVDKHFRAYRSRKHCVYCQAYVGMERQLFSSTHSLSRTHWD